MPTFVVDAKTSVWLHEFGGISGDDRRVLIVSTAVEQPCCVSPWPDMPPSRRVDIHFSHSSHLPVIH
jgi:hypothetical protein